MSTLRCEQPADEREVSDQMCIVEYTQPKWFKTGEPCQRSCTMREDISEDVVDCMLEKTLLVMEVNNDANNNYDAISHKTQLNCAVKEYPTQESILKLRPEFEETSDFCAKYVSTSGLDCETPLTDNEKELKKDHTFPKTTTDGELLKKETKSNLQSVDQQNNTIAKTCPFEPRGYTGPCLGSGIKESRIPLAAFVDAQQPFPRAISVTPYSSDLPQDTINRFPTPLTSGQEKQNVNSSFSFSETLDLAGARPQLYPETRTFTHLRPSSMPSNISTLVCGSLANLSSGYIPSKDTRENHCHFVEYSGPLPSPCDAPSSKETPHYFPPEVDKDLVFATVIPCQRESHPQVCKEVVRESPQKVSPPKTAMILEKAVISGVKPDRLRIPMSSSKDRLSEFRLESGLPGDLKIQAIPEVDIEKDPSREASPIPPDTSFTFIVAESVVTASSTPTSPKSPTEKPMDGAAQQTSIDRLPGMTACNDSEAESTNNKKTVEDIHMCNLEISQQGHAPQIVHFKQSENKSARPEKTTEVSIVIKTLSEEDAQISTDLAAKQPSSTTIIEKFSIQMQADMGNKIKIIEDIMEKAEMPLEAKKGDEEDQESKAEGRSDGNQDESKTGSDTNTVPCINQQKSTGCIEGAHVKEDQGFEATLLESQHERKEQGSFQEDKETQLEEHGGAGATAGEEPQTKNINILDTDKGLLKLQGT